MGGKTRLTIVPVSGLGNRMRVVASAIRLAPFIDGGIRIVWRPSWNCRAGFCSLFEPISIDGVTMEEGSWRDEPATRDNLWLPMLYRKFLYHKEIKCFSPNVDEPLEVLAERYDSLYIDTCYALGDYESSDVRRCFRPIPSILEKIDEITSNFSGQTLGVHIRRSDNRMAILHSPLSLFCRRIDELTREGRAERIFLSTDDESVRRHFRNLYGDRLITRSVCLNRGSVEGMRDAMTDLWCLSRSNFILGSYYSSFSDIASELTGTPIEIINNQHYHEETISLCHK